MNDKEKTLRYFILKSHKKPAAINENTLIRRKQFTAFHIEQEEYYEQ